MSIHSASVRSTTGRKMTKPSQQVDFDGAFKALTGHSPLSWQRRLYRHWFAVEKFPAVCDLPTGLGKTMVMAIWLIAWANNLRIPTRLIYVVDRRTVVDQATDLAEMLVRNWKNTNFGGEPPAISTLRGQLADNREWSRDPSRPAIIIGTVDLIGSALLFSGYRSSYKRRPLEAGLLGQDSLLVLDEAHLSKPFEKLACAIGDDGPFQKSRDKRLQGSPMRVIRMSATTSSDPTVNVFRLEGDFERRTEDFVDDTVFNRYEATKVLTITTLGQKEKLTDRIAREAVALAEDNSLRGKRIVVFVRKPDDAKSIAIAIRGQVVEVIDEAGQKSKRIKSTPYANSVAVLTGTMRGLERDELVDLEKPLGEGDHERRVMQRFLKPDNDPSLGSCFLISTSAGEVGFDLNADHLVGDEAPLDSWIQRLGRVNRRGNGKATVVLVRRKEPADKSEFDKACSATSNLLTNGMDVSPKALKVFKNSLQREQIERASSPKLATVDLTDVLLDAWSMTSITDRMPGRPDVGPWLRGIAEWEPPRTEIAWRAELDLDGFADLGDYDIEEWFDTHRILTHESLGANTGDVASWLKARWDGFSEMQQEEIGKRPVIIDRAGMEILPLGEVVNRLSRKTADADAFLRGAEIIVPASFGGIRRGVGLLDFTEPKLNRGDEAKPPEEAPSILNDQTDAIDVADVGGGRYREKLVKLEGGEPETTPLIPGAVNPTGLARYALELESDDEKTVRLVSYVPRRERPETGQKPQTLKQHVSTVRKVVDDIVSRLAIPSAIVQASQFAADWHDHGKARERWQRLLVLQGDFARPDEPMGKSGGEMKRDSRGYRHEFASLREFTDAFNGGNLLDTSGDPVNQDVFDLAAHLIAVHHGRGRPHFPKGGFDPDCEARSNEIHTEAIRRFARLQRRYGWWRLAWLENLLRCADALASANVNSTESDETERGE
ncbi:type I-U CRISPR-associated helicase/endonuclease Cas3 [Planctellipticum variicoloris]|uniref:type I-G CRISPR-associated helicase/endonuclease Cas3g n=1 Tax=Planctellipticum variicoloris TaxID=3064265 RepID=UPI003013501B|nr:type I-U CRISPR-associated helicase/endonuclease Cas3 [Planctomycetaceae bacterium SH412]